MIWTKYTIQTTTKDADLVSAVLMDYGIYDVQVENNVQLTDEELNQMYADFVKELPPDDGSCSLSFYLEFEDSEEETDQSRMIRDLTAGLDEAVSLYGIEPVELICEDFNSSDWENNWKEFFKPFSVDRILIAPTWEEIPEDPADILSVDEIDTFVSAEAEAHEEVKVPAQKTAPPDILIRIDPGMAFGTGTHETTRLCLRALQKDLASGQRVLDLGCGSGILGIAAMKLGAAEVVSVDIDEQAVRVAEENFEVNEISPEHIRFETGNVVTNEDLQSRLMQNGVYDLVTVNILADVIVQMMPTLDRYLRAGGTLITSGILQEREAMVAEAAALNPNLKLKETTCDGDWVSLVFTRQ